MKKPHLVKKINIYLDPFLEEKYEEERIEIFVNDDVMKRNYNSF